MILPSGKRHSVGRLREIPGEVKNLWSRQAAGRLMISPFPGCRGQMGNKKPPGPPDRTAPEKPEKKHVHKN